MTRASTVHLKNDRYRDADGILSIVRDGLCHRCGSCVGVCPAGTFATDPDGYPRVVADCIHCNICVRCCSGHTVDYPALGESLYGPAGYSFGSLMGPVRAAHIGCAAEPEVRRLGSSGGLVTGLLLHLLKSGMIRGALVAVEDPADPSLGKGIIARTPAQIREAAQSRYTTTPSFAALFEIRDEPGPFAVVGLPCQIHALRHLQRLDPRWRERIPLVIGLLCHYSLPALGTRESARLVAPPGARLQHTRYRQRGERGWPHNTLEMTFSDGTRWRAPYGPAQVFNVLARAAPLGRCLMCLDAASEFADVSVGDPWIRNERGEWKYEDPDGWSSVLVRTPAGEAALNHAAAAGAVTLQAIPPAEVERGQHEMMSEKKEGASLRIRARRLIGLSVPAYPFPLPRAPGSRWAPEIISWLMRIPPSIGWVRRLMLGMGFSSFGAYWINRRIRKRRKRAERP